ncbi:hypothetical protein CTEN210_09588 [Chaetoceros tenuissimus]|uniref:Uncharacterized protein n=1 Tax=Chaetoceros tenuissimus TaxID=426638 RepID=A0AAD3CVQ3_9STRA|nr:hypothetical protein CTEN210_09588 [Chaetoceros tenuissimus]
MSLWTLILFASTNLLCVGGFLSPHSTKDFKITRSIPRSKTLNEHSQSNGCEDIDRRSFIRDSILTTSLIGLGEKAKARGLVKFPCKDYDFLNTYHFFRAGDSLLEEEGIWSTNPLFLTNREAALSQKGIEQVEEMCKELRADGVAPTVVRYSLAAAAIDSSNIIGKELKVGRDRLVPEFNFMDPRAIGQWEYSPLNQTLEAVWALDVLEAGNDGIGGRPPSNEDGTPHETLGDQVVRLQNLISVLETQYSGDTVLLVFPDGTGPALLTCLIGGIPLNRVHEFEYRPGEVRLDINYNTARALLESKPSDEYLAAIERGQSKLKKLLDNPDESLNVRDRQYAEELKREEEAKLALAKKQRLEEEAAKKKRSVETQNISNQAPAQASVSVDKSMIGVGGITVASAIGAYNLFGGDNETNEIDNPPTEKSIYVKEETMEESVNGIPDTSVNLEDLFIVKNDEKIQDDVSNDVDVKTIESKEEPIMARPSPAWDPDEDDGGAAWLGSLSDIINEVDSEEKVSKSEDL